MRLPESVSAEQAKAYQEALRGVVLT